MFFWDGAVFWSFENLEAIQKQVIAIAEEPQARAPFFVSFPSILALQRLIPMDFKTTIQLVIITLMEHRKPLTCRRTLSMLNLTDYQLGSIHEQDESEKWHRRSDCGRINNSERIVTMKILYYDCFSGISGDMNLGAMIDLGVDRNHLLAELKKLDIGPYEVKISRDQRGGITGTKVAVIVGREAAPVEGRTFRSIAKMIADSDLSETVKAISLNIFTKMAEVEAKVHGHALDEVHFHEVGAIDSIVDIVGAAVCLDYLQVDRILSSPVEVGSGFVTCAHGILPVPAPATAEILKGIPIRTGGSSHEATTPTGAAILAATVDRFMEITDFTVKEIGYGIGQRETDRPNVLRVFLGEWIERAPAESVETEDAFLVECNIDDMNPELYDDVMDSLFQKGALDVFLTPVIMKKSRPAIKISLLCGDRERQAIEEILWLKTSTFGLRTQRVSKTMLKRDFSVRSTKYGAITMKNAYFRGKKIKSKPEYEDCRRLAGEKGVSVKEIYDSILYGDD
jgi:hypothetical protein